MNPLRGMNFNHVDDFPAAGLDERINRHHFLIGEL